MVLENQKTWLTHLVDKYTFGEAKLADLLGMNKPKNNPSEEHWLSMNLDFQKGVVKESAIEWAQAVANRDNSCHTLLKKTVVCGLLQQTKRL